MLLPWSVLLGLETLEDMSKPVSLLYDPAIFWDNAISLARSMVSIHSSADVLEGSPVVVEDLTSSKV